MGEYSPRPDAGFYHQVSRATSVGMLKWYATSVPQCRCGTYLVRHTRRQKGLCVGCERKRKTENDNNE